ncbi:MAG: hypothetical protein CMO98_06030 [Woeseia sp.]|mgnify:FL=1|nr:hypothetical protein [Woeseia sp.]|tara:strand:- start:3801 stop:4913 length:1113 start_codon:yes stop_codon:yes gene_type:complete
MTNSWFQRYLLPGFVFQSVVIAGAYGSGKELEQFFFKHGPLGGLLGMAVTMVIFSLVLMVTYEFSRRFKLFDYRNFCKALLGPAWPIYEVLYILQMILVISIVGATAGNMLHDAFGFPPYVGTTGIMALIGLIVFFGTTALEKALTVWTLVLYATYLAFFSWNFLQSGDQIISNLQTIETSPGWWRSGVAYSGYNMAVVPAILFCVRRLQGHRDAIIAGALAGPLTMLPAMLFFVAMIGQYGSIKAAGGDGLLPLSILVDALAGGEFFVYLFPVVLFGTFVETGAAMIHGVNERIDSRFAEKGVAMPNGLRLLVALIILVIAIFLADSIGLTNLVAKGYGTITWGFLIVFVVPVLTFGIWRIYSAPAEKI